MLITGCHYSQEEQQQIDQYVSQAKENAQAYIQQKYGFEASIVSTDFQTYNSSPVPDFTPDPTGNVYVEMKYQNKTFDVFITGEKESLEGYDNYQYQNILRDLLRHIKHYTHIDPYEYQIYYGYRDRKKDNGLISLYYTGDNLMDIMTDNQLRIVCEYIEPVDLKNIKTDIIPSDSAAIFLNYKSIESYHQSSTHSYNILGYPRMDICENALNLDSVLSIDYGETEYYEFDLQQYEDIYIYNTSLETKVTLTPTHEISDASLWKGYGSIDGVWLSDAYDVKGDYFYIYIPIDKVKDYKRYDDVMLAMEYDYNGEHRYQTRSLEHIGDYLVQALSIKDYQNVKFAVMGDRGL